MPAHLFTVDVEDYFHVSAFDDVVSRASWKSFASRVHIGTDRLLDLLASHGATGTFFVLGWVAREHPELVRRIAAAGHEIGSHTFWHRRVPTVTPAEFREDLIASKQVLEDLIGEAVQGFRAPSFSLVPGTEWVFDELLRAGFCYDSSVFPIRRPGYGYPSAPLAPYRVEREGGTLMEFPMVVFDFAGTRLPAAGGGYLRHFPLGIIQRAFRQQARRGPGVFYVHPWELDPDQPRLAVSTLTRVRHYRGLASSAARIRTLLEEFQFTSIREWLQPAEAAQGSPR